MVWTLLYLSRVVPDENRFSRCVQQQLESDQYSVATGAIIVIVHEVLGYKGNFVLVLSEMFPRDMASW